MSTGERSNGALAGGLLTLVISLAPVAGVTPAACAHEYWLEAAPARARAGDVVLVRGFVGTGFAGEPNLYDARRAVVLQLRAGRGVDLRPLVTDGSPDFARIVAPDDSGFVVGYVSDFSHITLDGANFDRYLEEEGLEAVRRQRAESGTSDQPARERYRRSITTWVAGTASAPDRLQPMGLPLELVPLEDPSRADAPDVRLLHDGHPLAGALVRAWWAPRPADDAGATFQSAARDAVAPVREVRTDARGEASLGALSPGLWLVTAVHMTPSRSPETDWESTWTSLTFRRDASATPASSAPTPGAGRPPRP